MSKNYLDIAANGNLVKKSIEELCFAISQNPEENSGKYFRLRYDTENEHTNELDRVSIVLEAIKPEMPKINGKLGQILINDGNNWITPSEIFFSSNETETRVGPSLIDTSKKSFILNGNPLFKTKEDGSLRDNETFNFSLNDFANISFGGENLSVLDGNSQLILHDNSKLNLTRNSQIYAHGPVQFHIDDGKYYSRVNVYSELYYSDIGGRPSPDLTPEEIRTNPSTIFSFYSSDNNTNFSSLEELIAAGYVLEENNSFSKYSSSYYLSDTFISTDMKDHYSGDNSTDSYLNAAAIRMHDKALFSMDGGASIIAHDTPQIYFEDSAKAYVRGNSVTEINGNAKTRIIDDAYINISNGSLTLQNKGGYDSCLHMNGGTILFNTGDKSKVPYDPYLLAESNQITFIGQAATGAKRESEYYNYPNPPEFLTPKMVKFEGSFTFTDPKATESVRWFEDFTESNKEALISALRSSEYNIRTSVVQGSSSVTSRKIDTGYSYTVSNFYYGQGSTDVFGDLNDLVPENNNPRFKIANESMIVIDTDSNNGANYIRIGAADKLLQIIKMGNIFEQMTGNAHSEMHDDSCFIMRGTTTKVPWKEGMKPDQWTKTHLDKSWYRPITTDNGPLFSMYDKSQFIMRGNWDYSEEYSIYSSNFTFIDENIEIAPTSIETMTEETKKKFFNAINKIKLDAGEYTLYNNLKDAYDEETGELLTTISSTSNPDGGLSLTISKFKYNSVPENWNEFLEKVEGQSLLEVIENAEVRIKGDSVFKMNDFSIVATSEGISFGNGEDSVIFSIDELKKLKTFLNNSEIEE